MDSSVIPASIRHDIWAEQHPRLYGFLFGALLGVVNAAFSLLMVDDVARAAIKLIVPVILGTLLFAGFGQARRQKRIRSWEESAASSA